MVPRAMLANQTTLLSDQPTEDLTLTEILHAIRHHAGDFFILNANELSTKRIEGQLVTGWCWELAELEMMYWCAMHGYLLQIPTAPPEDPRVHKWVALSQLIKTAVIQCQPIIQTTRTLTTYRRMLEDGTLDPLELDPSPTRLYQAEFQLYGLTPSPNYLFESQRRIRCRTTPIIPKGERKIVCFSDTHGRHEKLVLPEASILICCGDVSQENNPERATLFFEWFVHLPHPTKIFVPGNHDPPEIVEQYTSRVHFLIGETLTVDGLKIYGHPVIPYRPHSLNNSYAISRREMAKLVTIPEDIDLLVTHSPPWGIGDANTPITRARPEESGDLYLRTRVAAMPNLKYHVFGHIHAGVGAYELSAQDTTFINTSGQVTTLYL